MADGRGKGVRRVVRGGHFVESEKHAKKLLHLRLFGPALPNDGLFDYLWGVLIGVDPVTLEGKKHHSPCLGNGNGTGCVLGKVEVFNAGFRRVVP